MDKKRFTRFLVLALSISLAAGCASRSDHTRSDGALTSALSVRS